MTRRRKCELAMQCWASLNHLSLDPELLSLSDTGELEEAISRTLRRIERDYRVLARWRRPFRV